MDLATGYRPLVPDNPTEYVFSSITASVDSKVAFRPVTEDGAPADVGQLVIPMSARFIINDGQHRRAGFIQPQIFGVT
jgi:DNA sulfur modification protein DndB